jgi:hypothetical protein
MLVTVKSTATLVNGKDGVPAEITAEKSAAVAYDNANADEVKFNVANKPVFPQTTLIEIKFEQIDGYVVSFNANGGSGTMLAQQHALAGSTALTECAFTAPAGKEFAGWATTSDGEVEYTDGQSVSNLKTKAGEEIVLYAVWKVIEPFRFYTYEGSGYTAPISRDGTAYKYYCEFGTYPQSYCETTPDISNLTPKDPVTYDDWSKTVTFYTDAYGENKYASVELVGEPYYYAFEPIRWVVLGVDEKGEITFDESDQSVKVASTTATLFTTSTSNLTLEDNRIKRNGVEQTNLLLLSELVLDSACADCEFTYQWSLTYMRLFLNNTANDMKNFASISGLGDYYEGNDSSSERKYIEQTFIARTMVFGARETTDNMFVLGGNEFSDGGPTFTYGNPDSYNIASYFPICTGSPVSALIANRTPYAYCEEVSGTGTATTAGTSSWWLRTGTGFCLDEMYVITDTGDISPVDSWIGMHGVRPCFRLNLA